MSVLFTQSCPICGRRVQIRTSLLGRTVACQHCNGEFIVASGLGRSTDEGELESGQASDPLMQRVEMALRRANASSTAVSS